MFSNRVAFMKIIPLEAIALPLRVLAENVNAVHPAYSHYWRSVIEGWYIE